MTQPDLPDWIATVSVADNPTVLGPGVISGLPYIGPVYDVSPWASVVIAFNSVCAAINGTLSITLTWSIGVNVVAVDTFTTWGSLTANVQTGFTTIAAPCRGTSLQISVTGSAAGNTIGITVFGSRRTLPQAYVSADPQAAAPALAAFVGVVLAPAATLTLYFGPTTIGYEFILSSSAAGPAVTTLTAGLSVGGVFGQFLVDSFNLATGTTVRPVVYIPRSALRLVVLNNGAANITVQGTVTPVAA